MTNLDNIGKEYDQRIDQTVSEESDQIDLPGFRIIGQCGGGSTAKVYVAIQKSLLA